MRQPPIEAGSVARAERFWLLLALVATLIGGLIPLIWDRRYYFHGDTQIGAVGQWFHLGQAIRGGQWPILDVQAWAAGNFISEGQWGLFSPLTILIALAITGAANLVVFVSVLKIGLLLVLSCGTFALCRSYGADARWSALAALVVPLGGVSQYLDSPSWVTGQMVVALLPWAWVFIRRTVRGANPLPALVTGYLVVSVGYVYGTIYLALVFLVIIIECLLDRDVPGTVRVLLLGVLNGLAAITVYLPGLLSASVTTRGGWELIDNGRLQPDLLGVFASMVPTVVTPGVQTYPAHYIAWLLPAVLWLDWSRVKELLRRVAGLVIMTVVALLWVLGPNQFGPIRWPVRVMPLLVLGLVTVLMVLLSRARRPKPPARGLVIGLVWTVLAGFLVTSRMWETGKSQVASVALVAIGLSLVWFILRRSDMVRASGRLRDLAILGTIIMTLLLAVVQHRAFPIPPAVDYGMPEVMAAYSQPASAARGDGMLVGDPTKAIAEDPAVTEDFVLASSWFLTQRDLQSVYSTIGFTEYNRTYCRRYNGTSCKQLLTTLFEREPTTGELRADLLSLSTIQIFREGFTAKRLLNPPDGWSVAYESADAVTWRRDTPAEPAGGVVWASEGTKVEELSRDSRSVSFRVSDVPASGGEVAFSRLAWPGYHTSTGSLAEPVEGYLLRVGVPADARGSTIVVRFSPRGWPLEVAAWWISVLISLLWGIGVLLAPRLGRRHTPDGEASRRDA